MKFLLLQRPRRKRMKPKRWYNQQKSLILVRWSTYEIRLGAFSVQQKSRFEISELISHAQWNGTFRLQRPDPSNRAFSYCSWKQDTKQRYWGQQFWQMERDISVQLTEITGPVKEDHLQSWSRIFRSDQTDMVRCIWNFRNFGLNGKRPIIFL